MKAKSSNRLLQPDDDDDKTNHAKFTNYQSYLEAKLPAFIFLKIAKEIGNGKINSITKFPWALVRRDNTIRPSSQSRSKVLITQGKALL